MSWRKKRNSSRLTPTTLLLDDVSVNSYGTWKTTNGNKNVGSTEKLVHTNAFLVFKYVTNLDIALMLAGTLFAVLSGAVLPILGLFFGGMTNTFINQATNGLIPDEQLVENKPPINGTPIFLRYNPIPMDPVAFNLSTSLTVSEFREELNKYLTIYLVIGSVMLLCSFLQTLCWENTSEHLVYNIRQVYFSQILRQDISWYDQNDNGNLPNKLADDSERIREGTGYKVAMVVQYISTFVAGIAVGLCVNIRLTLLILCVTPFLIALMAYTCKFAAASMAREQEKYGAAGAVAEEALTNIKTVNAFGGQPIEVQRYNYWLEEGRKMAMNKYNIFSVCIGFTFLVMYGAYALGFAYGSYLVQLGISSPGSVFTVFFSVVVSAVSVGSALPFVNIISGAMGVLSSVHEIISRHVIVDPYSNEGRKATRLAGKIEFKNVSFVYPTRPSVTVLDGFNLVIESGKKIAIVGSSGAGKSTIINLILRFYDPVSGEVSIDGVPVKEYNISKLRKQIGLVSQEPVLFGVSIAENISYGSVDVTLNEIIVAAKCANAHNFIVRLPQGYETLVGDTGSQLSGGQKQRIAIARALVGDPKILLLDEATSALDARSEGVVQRTLESAMKGRTTVIVAHRLSTIRYADTICVMRCGKLFESGTHDVLMEKRSAYYELVQTQMSKCTPSDGNSSTEESSKSLQVKKDSDSGREELLAGTKNVEEKANIYNGENQDSEHETIITTVTETREIVDGDSEGTKENHQSLISETDGEHETDKEDDIGIHPYVTRPRTKKTKNKRSVSKFEKTEKDITVWQLLKMQKPEKWWLLLGLLGVIGNGLVTPIFALYYGAIFKVFTLSGVQLYHASKFWTYMFVAFAMFVGVAFTAQIKGMTEANEKLIARSRALVFENILKQPVGWFDLDASSPGILVNRLARNAPLIKAAAGMRAGQVLSSAVTLVCAFAVAFACGWKLALILAVVVPVIIGLSFKQQMILNRNAGRDVKLMDIAGNIASETVRHIRTVQALAQEKLFTQIYASNLKLPYREGKKQALYYSSLYGLTQGLMYYMYAIAFRMGGYLVEIGDMTSDDIYKVFFALSLCANAVGTAFSYMQDYNKARVSVRMLNFLMTRQSEIDSSSSKGARPQLQGAVEFRNVHFTYPTRPNTKVLKGLSFTVSAGQTLALVGESGCGKSTVISLLERFYDPASGSILVDGYESRSLNLAYLRSIIGLVTQEPTLFDTTIRDNIAYGALTIRRNVPFENIKKAAEIANVHNFIMTLPERYDTVVGERGIQLSGGQKQRVAIARALIRNPMILLLDEATSALDSENEKLVQSALDEAKQGRTCIVIAHRLSTIHNCDIICVVHKGKIVESGSHNELLDLKGQYYELNRRQTL